MNLTLHYTINSLTRDSISSQSCIQEVPTYLLVVGFRNLWQLQINFCVFSKRMYKNVICLHYYYTFLLVYYAVPIQQDFLKDIRHIFSIN